MLEIRNKIYTKDYDTAHFDFKSSFEKALAPIGVTDLGKMHEQIDPSYLPSEHVTVENDQDLDIYKDLYRIDTGYDLSADKPNGAFLTSYIAFIEHLAEEVFDERLVYQAKPTLRVHFPNNMAVGGFHRDSEYNHPIEEVNIWVPMTTVRGTNGIWLESYYDKKDYAPSELGYGKYLIFDSLLDHGNKPNTEGITRLSFDCRVIPVSQWQGKEDAPSSVTQHKQFAIGDYYALTDYGS
jgi:hypothetical protein